MEQTTSQISPTNFKSFVRHLCTVTKKHEEKDLARQRLKQQFKNLKQVTLTKTPKRWVVEEELRKLEGNIIDVLMKEAEILRIGKEDSTLIKELKDRIQKLEFQLDEAKRYKEIESQENKKKIMQLSNALSEIRGKVNLLAAKKGKRKAKRPSPL